MSGVGLRGRWAGEALVIVASVLMAFWIDAWWDGVQAERQEAGVVRSAREELERNRTYIRGFVGLSGAIMDRIERFLNATEEEVRRTPADSVELLVEALWLPPTFDPEMAAVSVLLETPPLPSEQSVRIHRVVSRWRSRLDDAKEEGSDLRAHASLVVDMLAAQAAALPRPPRSAPGSDWSQARQNRTFISSAIEQGGPDTLARLRTDEAFSAALARKLHHQRRYVVEIARASETLDSVLAVLPGGTGP